MARPTMRAARYYGKEDIRIEQIPEYDTGPGQIKVDLPLFSFASRQRNDGGIAALVVSIHMEQDANSAPRSPPHMSAFVELVRCQLS